MVVDKGKSNENPAFNINLLVYILPDYEVRKNAVSEKSLGSDTWLCLFRGLKKHLSRKPHIKLALGCSYVAVEKSKRYLESSQISH